MSISEVYLEPSRISTMLCFCEKRYQLTARKISVLDIQMDSEYASPTNNILAVYIVMSVKLNSTEVKLIYFFLFVSIYCLISFKNSNIVFSVWLIQLILLLMSQQLLCEGYK